MQRILRNTSTTLTHVFYTDGTATNPDPDSAVVTITREDGTIIVTDDATIDEGTGIVSYTLTPTETALLDMLRFDWEATFGDEVQTFTDYVEVVGGFLFTIAQARALTALANPSTYTTQAIIDARTAVESDLEHACGRAFVPRYSRQRFHGNGRCTIMLAPRATSIRSATLDGTAISAEELAALIVLPTGEAYNPSGWTAGAYNYDIAFEHGHLFPPPGATEAALTWAKNKLVKGPIDDRTTAFTTEDGTFSMSTPGMRGAVSGIPVVDSFIMQYDLRCAVG